MSKGLSTREHIIKQSAELFNIKGYVGTSLRDIMDATGLQKGGIYNHFRNKEEIALAAYEYASKLTFDRVLAKLGKAKTSFERIIAILAAFKNLANQPVLPGGCPICKTALTSIDVNPQLFKRAKADLLKIEQLITSILEDCQNDGYYSKDLNASYSASMMLNSLSGAMMLSSIKKNATEMRTTVKTLEVYLNRYALKAVA